MSEGSSVCGVEKKILVAELIDAHRDIYTGCEVCISYEKTNIPGVSFLPFFTFS